MLVLDVEAGGRALVRTDTAVPELVLVGADGLPPALAAGAMFLGVEPDGTAVFCVHGTLPTVPETGRLSCGASGTCSATGTLDCSPPRWR